MRKIHVVNINSSDIFKVLMHVKIYNYEGYNTEQGWSIFVQNAVALHFTLTTYTGSRRNVREIIKCKYNIIYNIT